VIQVIRSCVFFYIKLLKLNSGIPPHATVCLCVCVMEQGPRCHFLCDPPGTSFFIVHYQLLFPSPFPQSSSVEFVPFNRKCRFHGNQFNLLFLQMKLVLSLWKVFFFFLYFQDSCLNHLIMRSVIPIVNLLCKELYEFSLPPFLSSLYCHLSSFFIFLFFGEGPRSRCYGRTAVLRLIVLPCDEDEEKDDLFFFIFPCNRAPVEWNWQGKTEVLVEKPVPVPLFAPQIPHGMTPGSNPGLRGDSPATNRLTLYCRHSLSSCSSHTFFLCFIWLRLRRFGGTRWRSWLRHCATNRNVAGSIPDFSWT
jgi:hypothetical protein